MAKPKAKARYMVLSLLLVAVFLLYGVRLMEVQIVQGEDYRAKAERTSSKDVAIRATRGEIVDRYGRPLAVNRMGYNIIFDKAFMKADSENQTILTLIQTLTKSGEEWNDTLPLSRTAPYTFDTARPEEVASLKERLRLNVYATEQNVMDTLVERYKIEGVTPDEARLIAGVRYEMELREYSLTVPFTFAEDVSIDTVLTIEENSIDLPGVDIQDMAIREYVDGTIAPHILGRIGPIYAEEYAELKEKGYSYNDVVGKEGIEKVFEDYLRGEDGVRTIEQNARGDEITSSVREEPKPGNTVVLTIDKHLQQVAQNSLEARIKELQQTAKAGNGAESQAGAAVVLNVKTGEVLAMATYPSYNLNTFKTDYNNLVKDELQPLFNRATQGLYMPGSTFKPVVAIGGLEEGTVEPSSTVTCTRVYNFWESYPATCMGYHGATNVMKALQVSCNIYFYDVGRRLGIDNINKYAHQLGLGVKTGLELPEKAGVISNPQYRKELAENNPKLDGTWYPGNVAQAAIGQLDTAVTPLQLAQMAATIANNGVRYNSRLVQSVMSNDYDQVIKNFESVVANDLNAKQSTMDAVRQGMLMASKPGGSASGTFGSYPIDIASKTGTPQAGKTVNNAAFVAFGPYENSEIAVSVVVEKGGSGYLVGPILKDIFDAYFFSKSDAQKPVVENTLLP